MADPQKISNFNSQENKDVMELVKREYQPSEKMDVIDILEKRGCLIDISIKSKSFLFYIYI